MNLIALSIPAFLALIAVELAVARLRHRRVYRLNDAVSDLSCGITSQIVGSVLLGSLGAAAYLWVFAELRLWDLREVGIHTAWIWLFGLLGVDLIYYWWHRASHEVNLLWAAHVVHHHSEDYNLAVALRQAWFTGLTAIPFYLVLAVLGLPPPVYFISKAVNTLYQFWIHTELIGDLGPLERVLNTPAHHRVHHAINAEYLDRNYAGILIVWDRLFGTFEPERARPVYGTTKPLRSFNPVWANLHYFVDIARKARGLSRWRDKLWLWFAHPGWSPGHSEGGLAEPELSERRAHKYDDDRTSPWIKGYILLQLGLATYATTVLLAHSKTMSLTLALLAAALVVMTAAVWSGLFEGKRWAWPLELARLAGAAALLYAVFAPDVWPEAVLIAAR
ncbi:MAG: sterol desaturase family protein [Myxococcales bacterium]|nr:sterol desaturase family protein [Myxococcales bacterium]